jgi:hypothetical protein
VNVAEPNTCLNNKSLSGGGRVRFMPLVDPSQVAGSFEEEHGMPPPPGQWNVYVRMTDTCEGVGSGTGPLLKAIHLVE